MINSEEHKGKIENKWSETKGPVGLHYMNQSTYRGSPGSRGEAFEEIIAENASNLVK